MSSQVFCSLVLPFCISYVSEGRHRAMFALQLRDQLSATRSTGVPGPSSSAAALANEQTLNSEANEPHRTDLASGQHRRVDDTDEQPAPILAGFIFVGAWLPVVSVLMWHVICRVLL